MSTKPKKRRRLSRRGQQLHGGAVIWKPVGMTSREAVDRARWRLRCAPLGHTGTLDPLACGLMVVLGGEGRKFQHLFTGHDKEYIARVVLGMRSGSGDGEGPLSCVVPRPLLPQRSDVEAAVAAFVGEYDHVPPVLSAVRVDGKRSYEWARAGQEVAPQSRRVQLSAVEVCEWKPPVVWVRVACSSGTYIRSLVADLGTRLGCGAFLAGLVRTRVGDWEERDATSVQTLVHESWLTLEQLLVVQPRVHITADEQRLMSQGGRIPIPWDRCRGCDDSTEVLVVWCEGRVIGLAEIRGPELKPKRWLSREYLASESPRQEE